MSNVGDVNGMVAVVTSGALGMGAAHVRALAREGAIVAATDIIDDLGASLAEQLQSEGRDVSYYHHDVTSRAGWETVVASVQHQVPKRDANPGAAKRRMARRPQRCRSKHRS